jgi:alpha-ketoglutarate-dependent 2,4-dichlorophenoxyacetate dioxygenase
MPLEIRKLGETFGAEVSGIDIARPLTPEDEADIVAAMSEYGVCIYRDTGLTDDTHVWFSRLFGNLWTVNGQVKRMSATAGTPRFASPYLFDAGNLTADGAITRDETSRKRKLGDRLWHTDSSFTKERTTYSLLLAHEVTKDGGETYFADMRAAYDALPETMKTRIEGLVAEHSYLYSRMLAGFPITEEETNNGPVARMSAKWVSPPSRVTSWASSSE